MVVYPRLAAIHRVVHTLPRFASNRHLVPLLGASIATIAMPFGHTKFNVSHIKDTSSMSSSFVLLGGNWGVFPQSCTEQRNSQTRRTEWWRALGKAHHSKKGVSFIHEKRIGSVLRCIPKTKKTFLRATPALTHYSDRNAFLFFRGTPFSGARGSTSPPLC